MTRMFQELTSNYEQLKHYAYYNHALHTQWDLLEKVRFMGADLSMGKILRTLRVQCKQNDGNAR